MRAREGMCVERRWPEGLSYQKTKSFTVFSDPGNIPFLVVQANSHLGTSFHILYVKARHNLTGEADQKSLQWKTWVFACDNGIPSN